MRIATLIYIEKVLKENARFDESMYNHSYERYSKFRKLHEYDEEYTSKEKRELDEAKEERDKFYAKHIESRDAYEDFLSHDFR